MVSWTSRPSAGSASHVTNVDASKLDHYLRVGVSCQGNDLTLGFTNGAPERLPEYAQSHLEDLAPTTHRILVDVFLPPTREAREVSVDGTAVPLSIGTLRSWTVARRVIDIPRDATVEMLLRLDSSFATPQVDVQPLTVPATVNAC